MPVRPTIYTRLYRDFLAIEPKDYHAIIRYYETWEAPIGQLDEEQHYKMLLAFTHALFEVGAYRQFLAVVHQAILVTLDPAFRADESRQQTEFELLLFRKSAAFLQVLDYQRAEHIARELLRINPTHHLAGLLLQKSLRRQYTDLNRITRAAAILLFGLSAFIIVLEVLVVRSFYNQYTAPVEWSRNLVFLAGLLVLGLGEGLVFLRAYRAARGFAKSKMGSGKSEKH